VSGSVAPTPGAFDAVAPRSEEAVTPDAHPLVRLMRARALAATVRHFPAGSTLLEIGCGTGQDTLELTARGHHVVACDPSVEMLATTEATLAAAGCSARVTLLDCGVAELAAGWPSLGLRVDGVFSSFGPLNSEPSLDPIRRLLEQALRPGGRFVGVVLPKINPLEVLLALARGDVRTAVRRFRGHALADVEGGTSALRYYGAGDFDRALGGGFRRIETRSLGLLLPPPSRLGAALARAPALVQALTTAEDACARLPGIRRMGDHVILVYQRV
jgi:SAM-dependent methyltransferase